MRNGLRAVDILITWSGGKVALEIDGPHHFRKGVDGQQTQLTSATLLRDVQLQRWGYTVVSAAVTEDVDVRSEAFRAGLLAKLCSAGVPFAQAADARQRMPSGSSDASSNCSGGSGGSNTDRHCGDSSGGSSGSIVGANSSCNDSRGSSGSIGSLGIGSHYIDSSGGSECSCSSSSNSSGSKYTSVDKSRLRRWQSW